MPEAANINNPPQAAKDAAREGRDLCPLSFAQERLWFLDQLQPGNPAYNIPQAWRLEGEFDLAAFEASLNQVVCRHETLRTSFSRVEGKPVEVISAFKPIRLNVLDLSARSQADSEVRRLMAEATRRPFDLQQEPLFAVQLYRLSVQEHIALFNLHHIIADAWSFEILRREISEVYAAAIAGKPLQLPELPIQYLDYAHWQREQSQSETFANDLAFWKEHFGGELPDLELPCDHARAGRDSFAGRSEHFELSAELTESLSGLARQEGATLFTVLLAALKAFLHRITGQTDLVVGTPISGRDQTETEGLIGIFVNTMALRTDVSGNPTFLELLARVRETAFSAFAHQAIPFDEVVKALRPERALGRNPLFQVVLGLHGGYPSQWTLGPLRGSIVPVETNSAKFDWTFLLEQTQCGIRGCLEYKADLFEAKTIQRFLQYFQILLKALAENPNRRLCELPLSTKEERQQVLVTWNQTTAPYERDACIHEVFERQVEKSPEAVALVFGHEQITYRQLNQRANRLAGHLRKAGSGPDRLIGVCLDRSPDLIVALLAILKAGGAYVPLDRTYPRERLAFMIEDAGLSVVVADAASGLANLPDKAPQVICLDQETGWDSGAEDNLAQQTTAESLAYVMYTSGSTGTPKGTLIPHRAVVRLVRHTNYVRFSPADVFLQIAPISFDASTFEIWGCLLNGAKLVLFPSQIPSCEELGRSIEQHRVSTLWLTAGLFHQMVDQQLDRLKTVRQFLAGGDVLSVPHVLRAIRQLPGCRLINGYGPTENTTFTCCYPVPPDWAGGKSVPIGKPISNTRVYILDDYGNPAPIGVAGELLIAGDGLARGYLKRSELDGEKFLSAASGAQGIALPVAKASTTLPSDAPPLERLYRTGDRARWMSDGNIEFLGRKDRQVKLRGFRVEPAEIEAAVGQHPTVQEAVVVSLETPTKGRQLVAYVTLQPGRAFNEPSLREFLRAKLPAHLMPAYFQPLAFLPLTSNGKVDHRALPAPAVSPTAPGVSDGPRDSSEETLRNIWVEVLGHNGFGIHDNFFHLGGHSLLATQMVSRIARMLGVELPVRAVFEAPTIAGLAAAIEAAPQADNRILIVNRRAQRTEARRLLTQINTLSETEIDTLLARPN